MSEEPKMIIELGGGNSPQYHPNLDIKPGPGVDIVANLEEPLPISDDVYDVAVCNYALEHLSWRKVKGFLKEVFRILKSEGKFVAVTANLKEQAKMIAGKEWGDSSDEFFESRLIFGGQDYPDNTHKCGFSPELVVKWLQEAGFGNIRVSTHPNCSTDMIVGAAKPDMDRVVWLRKQLSKLAKTGTQIVDIGCSDCPVTYDRTNCIWVDIVPYEEIVRSMKHYNLDPIPRDKYVRARAEDLPFENKQFGIALITELLEHVSNPVEVLTEAKRIAKHAIITVPNEYDWSNENKPFQNPGHLRHYTEQMLRNDLSAAGIKEYVLDRFDYRGWSFFTIIANLEAVSTVKKEISFVPNEQSKIRNDKLKVALLSTPFLTVPPRNYGGLERIVADTAYCLAKEGHDVTVFCPSGSHVEGCETIYFGEPIDSVHCDWLGEEQKAANIVADKILNDGYQIVHGMNWFGFEYALKTRKTDLKCLHTHHGWLDMNWWGNTKPPFPTNLVAVSNHMRSIYKEQGFDSRVVYNGIPIEEYPYQRRKGDRLLFVGRLDSFKRPHIAIEVAKKTNRGLDIVGGSFVHDVNYMESIKKECDGKQIKLYLDADQKVKVELYQNAKAVLFPSEMGEPFGLITPEANCCGTSVIASRDGAIPEVLQDGVTGFVCDNVDQMIDAVRKVGKIKPKDCRKNGERFSRENMAGEYAKKYQEILEGQEW